jgi:hypothetical protein
MAKKENLIPVATPENTPLPGGGSWRWDETVLDWVENDPYVPPAATASAVLPDAAQGVAS